LDLRAFAREFPALDDHIKIVIRAVEEPYAVFRERSLFQNGLDLSFE
jgi:hypothetical protein